MTIVAMKIEKEMGNYWNGTGRFEDLGKRLDKMVPAQGECDKHHGRLERYRKMCNAYYDLFNNGGGNNEHTRVSYYFPKAITLAKGNSPEWDLIYEVSELEMDKAILDAALDTNLITREEWRLKMEEIE
jgi:hypothetical protein